MSYLITHTTVIQDGAKVGIGTTPSHKFDIDGDLRVRGNDIRGSTGNVCLSFNSSDNVTVANTLVVDGDGSSNGVTVSDGSLSIRTGTGSVAQIDLYCEVSNAHKVSIKPPAHSEYSGDVNFTLPPSNGTTGQALITDGSGNTSWSTVGGGGSSKASFVMRLAGRFVVTSTNTSRMFTHSSGMGNALGGDFSTTRTEAGTSDTTFTTTAIQAAYYYTIGVAPVACTLDTSSMFVQFRYTYANSPAYRVWKGTYTNGSGGNVTWTEVVSAQTFSNSSTTDACEFSSTTLSSGNSFAAGDLVGVTFQTGGTATSSSNLNQFTATLVFTET